MAKQLVKQYVFTPGIAGSSTIKIPGRYTLDKLLLITNVTDNVIIYNFADTVFAGTTCVFTAKDKDDAEDDDFPTIYMAHDGFTTITLQYNTSAMSAGDDLQIFVEGTEDYGQMIRPWPFGTDAIERIRVSNPQSMIDADFEYGLQPTKWSAIGTQRGYPSIYEIPGTDTEVQSVVTDGSAGTDGVGASLITVTTQGAHGFSPGTPITIKALEDSVTGASRAEGSFVITTVPTNNTFTYYAKAKVDIEKYIISKKESFNFNYTISYTTI